ncbi:MAG: hypothetical protein IH892_14020 [Planctomycetes bacterium]|nr:hypothetical protein [Planctomycetota bacterium]
MSRATIVVLTVMLVSSSALAQIPYSFVGLYQTQSQVGDIANTINIAHGDVGMNTVSLDIENLQRVEGVRRLSARQGQHSFLMQVGRAHAHSGHVSILQELGSAAGQIQRIGRGIRPKYQSQTNTLAGTQVVANTGGQGSGNAFQVGTVKANQYGENAAGYMRQSSTIDSLQNSSYTGDPGDTGRVESTVVAATEQSQAVW